MFRHMRSGKQTVLKSFERTVSSHILQWTPISSFTLCNHDCTPDGPKVNKHLVIHKEGVNKDRKKYRKWLYGVLNPC